MQARAEAVAVRRLPDLVGLITRLAEDFLSVPVLALAREVLAALDQQDALACARKTLRRARAARSRADDDDVVAIVRHGRQRQT